MKTLKVNSFLLPVGAILVLLVDFPPPAWAGNIATDSAARLIQGTNASVRYQVYQSTPTAAPQKVDAFMAPVLGAIKNGIAAGLDPLMLGTLHDQALNYAVTTASKLTPEQARDASFAFIGDILPLAFGNPGPTALKIIASKLGLDFIKTSLTAYMNPAASGQGLSRGTIVFALQPPNVQVNINNYYMTVMADAYNTATSNAYFAQSFDQIFKSDFGASIKDNATTILNNNLNLPDYFRTHANADGSLSVDIAGLRTVYGDQSQALGQASTQTINLAQFVDQAQRQSLLSNASLNTILQSVPAEVKQQVQAQYLANQKTIATANAGIGLAANLAGFFDQKTAQEISVYGNAAIQFTTAVNEFTNNAALTLTGGVAAVSGVAGAALAVYNLLQSNGPSQDAGLAMLGQEINQLRTQMNARFDIVDKELNTILQTINTNFSIIIPNLALIIQQLTDLQADLNRFERNFFDLEISGFVSNLDAAVTGCIAFRQLTGHNLLFSQYSGSTGCENTFYLWGTQNSITLATIPGNRAYDDNNLYKELTQPVANPDLDFFVDSANINYLSQYPLQRFGVPALSNTSLANPSVWAIAAQSHLQLARENPAYDATLSSSRLSDIQTVGKQIQQALKNVTAGSSAVFNDMLFNYSIHLANLSLSLSSVTDDAQINLLQQTQASLASTVRMTRCSDHSFNLAPVAHMFNAIGGPFIFAQNLRNLGRGNYAPLSMCFDIYDVNAGSANARVNFDISVFYGSMKVYTQRMVLATQSANIVAPVYISNWGTGSLLDLKPFFETGGATPPFWPPAIKSITDVFCGLAACPADVQALASSLYDSSQSDAAIQKPLYCSIIGTFDPSDLSPQAVNIRQIATKLAGDKAALAKYLLIGAPHSLNANDYLRALLYGKSALPGRADNGQDDIVANIYGPAVMAFTGAPTITQACGAAVTTAQPNPTLVDVYSVVSPQITNMQSALTDMLTRIGQNQISEYDDTLNSTLQSLQTFLDAKAANTVATSAGSNVTVSSPQNIQVTFPTVLQAGNTVTTATEPGAASGVPGGFVVNGSALTTVLAYDVETTATYVGPVTTCFTVNSVNDATAFAGLVVLHSDASGFVDHTISRDFPSRTICAKTDSLSPFAIALKAPVQAGATPQIVISKVLTRDSATNDVVVQLNIANSAGGMAQNVQLTIARVNTTSGTPLPQALGGVAVTGSTNATVRFPGSVGGPGVAAVLTIGGTYSGGSFNTATRITLP
jgi:hypothetical protein